MQEAILEKAREWTRSPFDEETRQAVLAMMEHDPVQLDECFYTDLEFGTGGMRGIMGPGTNRINPYTIAMATQGLCNYINKHKSPGTSSVAIAYDSRNNSPEFASIAADVFSANGVEVYLFQALRPTPQLSFAIRHLGCTAGIVITASHNPPEYNGYKVYWEDGGQIVPPQDKAIIEEVRAVAGMSDVRKQRQAPIQTLGKEMDEVYLNTLLALSPNPEVARAQSELGVVYSGLHGTGITLIPEALRRMGFTRIHIVPKQDVPDGNFPTVESPNPEEREALTMGIAMATEVGADLLLATDPDADRVGLAVRDHAGQFRLMNGNEAGSLIVYYCLLQLKETGKLAPDHFVAKTIVTSELIAAIAHYFDTPCYDTLTGFKWIAAKIREYEGKGRFVAGGEESYGYLIGDKVRDKDAVMSSLVIAEIAAWAQSRGKNLFDILEEIHRRCGAYKERLISLKREGKKGKQEIADMIEGFRTNPPEVLGGERVIGISDVGKGHYLNLQTGEKSPLGFPSSNVVQFHTEEGSKITARPSGTEPKIKFYVSVRQEIGDVDYAEVIQNLEARIDAMVADLGVS